MIWYLNLPWRRIYSDFIAKLGKEGEYYLNGSPVTSYPEKKRAIKYCEVVSRWGKAIGYKERQVANKKESEIQNLKKENIHITGDSVIIKSVTENDVEDYLYIKRFASIFKAAYDKENGFWEYMKPRLMDDINGSDYICLIYLKNTDRVIGYIDLEMKNACRPKVGIGILEDERKKGYAFEASLLLVQKVLEHDEIECVEWMTTSGNEASNRIAQKLGGEIIRKEPIVPKEVIEHWEDKISETEIPCYVVYGIYRK